METAASSALLARIAHGLDALEWSSLTPEAIAKAKLCLIDYLASAFAARDLPWSRQALELAAAGSTPAAPAQIVGTPWRAPQGDAAFTNAVLGHALVRDDMHLGSVSHLGTVVLPTLLALAESTPVDGKRLITALAAGYEAGGRLGRAILDVEVAKIFRPTGITGPFAAAAAAAKLLGLDADAFGNALGLAANTAAGYNEWATTGGSEMFFHPGFAARNGLTSALLAARGARISATALDGAAGILVAFDKLSWPDTALPFVDGAELLAVFFKEVPACNFAQTAAQVARDIALAESIDTDRIDRVEARVPRAAALYPGCDCAGPFTHILQAKMSIHYNVAAALKTGGFDEASYVPAANPEIQRLAALTTISIDDELTAAFPRRQGASVVVTLRNGVQHRGAAEDVKPASDALVRERFEAAATATLGAEAARELGAFIDGLESEPDIGALGRLTALREDRSA